MLPRLPSKVDGKSTALTPKKSVDLALLAHGARYDQDDHAPGCSFCVGSGQDDHAPCTPKVTRSLPFGTRKPVERAGQAAGTREREARDHEYRDTLQTDRTLSGNVLALLFRTWPRAPVHAQEVQELTCMAGRDRQDAGQDTSHAGPVPGTQNTAQGSEQGQASQEEEAARTEDTVQEEEGRPGPSAEELKARARELKAQGLNQSQIARAIGRSKATVSWYLKAEA